MKNKYLAGIDIGTTGSKSAIFDLEGNIAGSSYHEYECSYPNLIGSNRTRTSL